MGKEDLKFIITTVSAVIVIVFGAAVVFGAIQENVKHNEATNINQEHDIRENTLINMKQTTILDLLEKKL